MQTKPLRTLSRTLDNYTAALVQDAGLCDVPIGRFTNIAEFSDTFVAPHPGGELSSLRPIGFDFYCNNAVYRYFQASVNGYMLLSKAQSGVQYEGDVLLDAEPEPWIFKAPALGNIILAPWACRQRVTSGVPRGAFGTPLHTRTALGHERPHHSMLYDERNFGVQYALTGGPEGPRLVVRWHTFTFANPAGKVFRQVYEVVVHESGKIEYGYGPREAARTNLSVEDSADGVFRQRAAIVAIYGQEE